jgi:hypothetical protein
MFTSLVDAVLQVSGYSLSFVLFARKETDEQLDERYCIRKHSSAAMVRNF